MCILKSSTFKNNISFDIFLKYLRSREGGRGFGERRGFGDRDRDPPKDGMKLFTYINILSFLCLKFQI